MRPWWQTSVVYEVYVRSFQDTDGDGIGDLRGIERRLDHLVDLGVDALWLTPFYPSPMADFGYDVADYTGVDPLFGTMADFDALLAAAHARGLKLVLDLVPNHTSDQHPWFLQSRRARDDPRRDWYLWRDPAPDGGPPNNWQSQSGGPAWTLDPASGQYYYHAFLPQQPDLNWRNPSVQAAVLDAMRFWLERGVDGFRVDVIWHLIKDARFRDDPINPDHRPGDPSFRRVLPLHSADQPEVHRVIKAMRDLLRGYGDAVLIGEIYLPLERLMAYYGADLEGAHLPFNFLLLRTSWRAEALVELIRGYEDALPAGGWGSWVLGNHDQPRIASRIGPGQARVAMLLLLTLRGTPTLYYGDELGLTDVPVPAERVQDPFELRMPGLGQGRDPERAPMPWDTGPHAGFSTVEPWLPLPADRERIAVAAQAADPGSMLTLTRQILALRRRFAALRTGSWRPLLVHGEVLVYERAEAEQRLVVALNLGHQPVAVELPERMTGVVLLSTTGMRTPAPIAGVLDLAGDEGALIYRHG